MATDENFDSYAHQRIWNEMHNGAGVSPQTGSQWGWFLLAGRLANIRSYVDTAVAGVGASRQGAAADAATAAITPLGGWVEEARRLAHETADKIAEQNGSFSGIQSAIPEVVHIPPETGWRSVPVLDQMSTSDHERAVEAAKEPERIARTHMFSYQTGTNDRLAVMPQFLPPTPSDGGLDTAAGNKPGVDNHSGGDVGTSAGGTAGPAGGGPAGRGGSVAPFPGVAGGQPGEGGYQAPAATAGQGQGVGGIAGDQAGGRPGGTAGGGAAGGGAAGPGGYAPGVVGPGGGTARPGGRPAGAGGARLPGGAGRAAGGGVGGGAGGGRAGGGIGAGAGRGAGGGGGFGPTGGGGGRGFGPSGGGFGPSGGAGGRSGVGPMMGGMGAGRGQGGEDSERQRPSWLIEQDPNAIVGELPRTAPPVIGEDPPEGG